MAELLPTEDEDFLFATDKELENLEKIDTELRETRVRESNHKKDNDMTNTLKISGRIVGVTDNQDGIYIFTETQVLFLNLMAGMSHKPALILDITDYQDKPTEKELEEKKVKEEARERGRVWLVTFINDVTNKGKYNAEDTGDIIAAIAELNKMDEREEGK